MQVTINLLKPRGHYPAALKEAYEECETSLIMELLTGSLMVSSEVDSSEVPDGLLKQQ